MGWVGRDNEPHIHPLQEGALELRWTRFRVRCAKPSEADHFLS